MEIGNWSQLDIMSESRDDTPGHQNVPISNKQRSQRRVPPRVDLDIVSIVTRMSGDKVKGQLLKLKSNICLEK